MSDFIAHVKAELDTSEAEKKLNNLTGKNYKVNINTGDSAKSVDNVNQSLQNTQRSANNLGNALKKPFQVGSSAALAAKGIQLINTAARNATDAIKDVDSAITDLRMATNESYDTVSKMVSGYNDMGKALGATTKEVTSSADAWLRQGKTAQETNTLIKDSMMLSKIGQIDSASATEYLTSAMKGYGVEVQNVQGIVDKLCAVDLVSATDAAGLAEAMSRTAVTADMAGVSMDRLLGYLATVGEATQKSMSSIGESFKTIFTRMSDIKSDKLELIDEDGTKETLSDVELTLKNVGIDLRETVNEYNDYGDVLDNLASKWDSLSEVQQNALAKAFAGTRQQENFRVLMENYDVARQYMETAANSAGTAEEKFGAYLDSIEAKTKTLQASFESLAVNSFSPEMFGDIVDASSALIEFLDKTNLLKGSLAGLATAGAIRGFTTIATGIKNASIQMNNFNAALKMAKSTNLATDEFQKLTTLTQNLSQSQLKAVVSCKALSTEQRTAILMSTGMSQAEAQAALASMGLATAEGSATAATFSLSGAFKGLWATLMANPLILVIAGVTAAVSAYSSYKQKVEEARQAQLEAGNSAIESADNVRKLYTAYNEANTAYANNSGSKADLESATESLLSALGVEQSQIESLKEEYGSLDEAINQVTYDSLKDNLSDMTAGYKAAQEEMMQAAADSMGFFSGSDITVSTHGEGKKFAEVLQAAGYLEKNLPKWSTSLYTGINDYGSIDDLIAGYEKLIEMRDTLEKGVTDGLFTRDELTNSGVYGDINDKINAVKSQYEDVLDYIKQINETAAQLQFMDTIKETGMPKTAKEFDQLKASMKKTAKESGNFVGSQQDIEDAITNTLASVPELEDFYNASADAATDASDIITLANERITESAENASDSATKLIEGISNVTDILNSQQNGKSISIADFNSDELKDYQSALEYVNGTMQLNSEKVKEIAQAKADEQVAINNTNKALEQAKYLENAKQIEQYRQKLRDANFAEGESQQSVQASIDALLAENSAIADTCKQYDLLSTSIQEAVGSYQNWLNAQNGSDYGDMANDAVSAIQRIRDTYDSNSDVFGDFGSKKFEAAIDFIVPDSVDGDDLSAIESYMSDFKQYLKFDDNGAVDGLNIDKFLENSVNAGLMKYSEDDGFQVLGGKKMEDFAEGLNMSSGMVQAFFDELQLKGADFDWGDEAVKTIGDLAVEANEAAESLRQVDGNSNLKIKMDVSDLSTTEEQISALDATIAEMDAVKARPDVDASSIENANSVIQYCLTQKQLLSQPDVMRVDTSQVEGEISNAISLLQQFQTATNDLEIKQKVGADTTEAESKVNSLASEIEGISPDIKAKLDIDSTSVDSIKSSIAGLSAETINVKANVDASAIEGYNPDSKKCDVIYDPKTDALPESFDAINRDVNYVPHTGSLPESFTTLTRYVNYVKTGAVDVNGTAHVSGTAKAGGDWGTAPGGKTLVGELGREIVVDPHTGRWYTVGDNGAEFRDIPAGAIVFNHVQSESLLENGYVAGRAAALVSGTALVTGGYKPYKPSSSPSTKKSSSKSSSSSSGSSSSRSSSGSSSSKSSSSSSSSSSEKDFEETFDWIEIAIKRISEAIDRVKVKAESAFKTLAKRNSAAADEISLITQQINTQNQAYTRYMQQANSVGLSSDWMDKVKNGTIDISTITDEDLSDKIKDFQDFYEKAIEAKDAVADLHEEIAKLYQDKFDNTTNKYEGDLALLEHLSNTYNKGLDVLQAKGYKSSKVYYKALEQAETESISILKSELKAQIEAYSEAMNSGEIEKGSSAWYDMQKAINSTKESIQDAELSLLQYEKTMRELDWEYFDYMEDRISNITDEADFLIDLMANGKLFDDKGQMTDTGMATMGLHGQNYNVDMAQADQYAKAIKELNAEIAKDPYNTDLIERRQELLELQRKSILAAEDEKQAMIDLVKDGIEAQLDSLKDLIDAYTDSLDSAKDLYDYQKKVKEQSDEIASLQKQLSAYAGDNSEETKATIQKIQVDLSKAMEELQETEYDRYITDQKKLLDDLYNEYELSLNARLDNVDAFLSDMIDSINANSSSISDTIQQECANVGYTLSETMNSIWTNDGGAFTVISKYGDQFLTQNTSTLNAILGIKAYTDALIAKADAEAKAKAEATKKQTEASKPASQPSKPSNNTPSTPSKPARTDKDYYGVALAIWNGNYGWGTGNTRVSRLQAKGFDANRVQSIVNQMGREGYVHSGAWVGRYQGIRDLSPYHYNKYAVGLKNAPKAENAWVNELGSESIVKPSENAIVTHIAKGDSVLDAEATRNIWDMASDPSEFINSHMLDAVPISEKVGFNISNHNLENMNINLPNVMNYEDFANRLVRDKKFRDFVSYMPSKRYGTTSQGSLIIRSGLAKTNPKW